MDLLTGHHTEITHSTHHKILDQITEVTATPAKMITRIDKASAETTAGTEDTNNNRDMNREIRTTRTGMTTIKIEIGLTTEEDQININTTEINTKRRSSSNSQIKT